MEVSNADNYLYDRRKRDVPVENDRRNRTDDAARQKKIIDYAFDVVPTFRKLESVEGKMDKGDTASALGMAALAMINFPNDQKDVIGAAKQVKALFKGKILPKDYDHYHYQHNLSFFKGSAIDKWLIKNVQAGKKWALWLVNNDLTLADTIFGEKIIKCVKSKEVSKIETSIKNAHNESVFAYKYSGSVFGRLTARALRRTTKLGVLATVLLESPKIINAAKKGDNPEQRAKSLLHQGAKSAVNIATVTTSIAYSGAIGYKYGKGLGSLLGITFGTIMGSKLSEKLQNFI